MTAKLRGDYRHSADLDSQAASHCIAGVHPICVATTRKNHQGSSNVPEHAKKKKKKPLLLSVTYSELVLEAA